MLQENKIIELLPQVLSGDRLIEELIIQCLKKFLTN